MDVFHVVIWHKFTHKAENPGRVGRKSCRLIHPILCTGNKSILVDIIFFIEQLFEIELTPSSSASKIVSTILPIAAARSSLVKQPILTSSVGASPTQFWQFQSRSLLLLRTDVQAHAKMICALVTESGTVHTGIQAIGGSDMGFSLSFWNLKNGCAPTA